MISYFKSCSLFMAELCCNFLIHLILAWLLFCSFITWCWSCCIITCLSVWSSTRVLLEGNEVFYDRDTDTEWVRPSFGEIGFLTRLLCEVTIMCCRGDKRERCVMWRVLLRMNRVMIRAIKHVSLYNNYRCHTQTYMHKLSCFMRFIRFIQEETHRSGV